VEDEEEEEVEADPEIHCLGDTSPSQHLTQSSYEQYLMDIQINELRKGEKAKENPSRYNLRSKKNLEKTDGPNQPVQKEDSVKVVTVSNKEKESKPTSYDQISSSRNQRVLEAFPFLQF
jgi:hypothetical protein